MTTASDPRPPPATVPRSERHTLAVKANGTTYRIDVALPYRPRDEGWPVVYVLDGDASFGGAASSLRGMLFDAIVPPMLVVGITPSGALPERMAARTRDFMPDQGAAAFLTGLTGEIVPWVEARYPVERGRRVLYGHSAGGLFATYGFFRAPGSFTACLASSPALWHLGRSLYAFESTLAGDTPPRGKLFLSIGELEQPPGNARGALFQNVDRLAWLVRALEQRAYEDVQVHHRVFPGDTHTTVAGRALCHGVWWSLGRSLDAASQYWAPIPPELRSLLEEARVPDARD